MVFEKMAEYTKELGSKVVETIDPSKMLDKMKAYGEMTSDGVYYCSNRMEFEKSDYAEKVNRINSFVDSYLKQNPSATIEEKADFLIKPSLENIGKQAACLKDKYGIDPDSLAKFSTDTQDIMSANMDRVLDIAPTLVDYATVPEFSNFVGSLSPYAIASMDTVQSKASEVTGSSGDIGLIVGLGMFGTGLGIYALKKLNNRNQRLFYKE